MFFEWIPACAGMTCREGFMKKAVNIGIIGFGNIGSSVARNLKKNSALIAERVGVPVKVISAADKSSAALGVARAMGLKASKNANDILNDPRIDIVVEAIGGEQPAKKIILQALSRGKNVVTSNKEVIAKNLKELISVAGRNTVSILFEAAVGGGIPIISLLREDLAGNDISQIFGIINGTTNYILSRMTESGLEFSEALFESIKKGYAEANPKMDIDGSDSAYKSVILSSVAFGADVRIGDVHVEGISSISQEDIRYAREMGYVVKLLSVSNLVKGELDVRVHPMLIPVSHSLASISGALNAIYIEGYPVGSVLVSAQGAGGDPTSSSVIGDVLNISKRIIRGDSSVSWKAPKRFKIKKIGEIESRYYVRLLAPDRYGVLSKISKAFSDAKVSIQAVYQKETVGNIATIVILISKVRERNLMEAVSRIERLPVVKKICSVIRAA
jgi:homoserine dehydrogenase